MIENNKALYPIWFIIECVRLIFQCLVDLCELIQTYEFSRLFKRKPKRLFYVKSKGTVSNFANYLTGVYGNKCWWTEVRSSAVKFTDSEYDQIKHLLPNDHTLELASND